MDTLKKAEGVGRKVSEMMKKLHDEAERILNSDNPPAEIKKHLDNLIAGEDENKLVLFFMLLSGKSPNPRDKQFILIKGEPGGGKTTLMSIADLFRTKTVARFSPTALDYTNLQDYEVLRLSELNDEEKQGVGNLKFLSADDGGYIIEYTVREAKTGRMATEERRIPAITVVSSTASVHLDEQLERRAWILNPDTSREQTKRILEFKAKQRREEDLKAVGAIPYTQREFSREVLDILTSKLKWVHVVIPFTSSLKELLNVNRLRVRGDFDKILAFITLYHQAWQKKLPCAEIHGERVVFADPEITMRAIELVRGPLINMLSGVEAREVAVLQALKRLGVTEPGDRVDKETRTLLARELGLTSERRVRELLNELEDLGYFFSEGGVKGRPKVYTLQRRTAEILSEISQLSVYSGDSRCRQNIVASFAKEALDVLNSFLEIQDIRAYYSAYLKTPSGTEAGEGVPPGTQYRRNPIWKDSCEITSSGDSYSGGAANRRNGRNSRANGAQIDEIGAGGGEPSTQELLKSIVAYVREREPCTSNDVAAALTKQGIEEDRILWHIEALIKSGHLIRDTRGRLLLGGGGA